MSEVVQETTFGQRLIGLFINSVIVFGLTFMTTLSGLGVVTGEVGWEAALVAAAMNSGLKFFTFLAHERQVQVPE